ncbi:MAG: TolC family protein [Pirellula sp.]
MRARFPRAVSNRHNASRYLRLAAVVAASLGGCALSGKPKFQAKSVSGPFTQLQVSDAVETANMERYAEPLSPLDIVESDLTQERLRGMTLEECLVLALGNSRVMRDLGVSVLRSTPQVQTNLDPAIVYSDPRVGEEAALSAFDANFFASSFYENNSRGFNNSFIGRDGRFAQDLSTTQAGFNKRSATGALFMVREVSVYDRNNQSGNRFGAPPPPLSSFSWDNYIEATAKQPLLLGAGTEFNRIAGPGATPGQLNGVLLARVRTDISLVDFEKGVRDFVADVDNAYWDLYFAYRDLEARIDARDIATLTHEEYKQKNKNEQDIQQAREQMIRFQADVVDALNGRSLDGTRTNNGSTGGTFRGIGGVRTCERKLRLLIGLPINDGVLIHPTDIPTTAPILFDWTTCVDEALQYREEIRRQRWVIKQHELELIANRNFLKPQLDAISTYRMRGFGQDWRSPWNNDFSEWALGLDYQMPVGFRRGNAAVRTSQLMLVRSTEILREQERAVHLGLSNAINESKRSFDNLGLQRERLDAITKLLTAISVRMEDEGFRELDVVLDTHRRLLDARLRYFQSEVEYELSLRNVNVEKGTLLRYCNVFLNESAATGEAIAQARTRVEAQDYSITPHHRDLIIGRTSPR